VAEGEEMGDDIHVGDDVGIGRYIDTSTNEFEKNLTSEISEREGTPSSGSADPQHVPQGLNRPQDEKAAESLKEYNRLSKKSQESSKAAGEQLPRPSKGDSTNLK
jgi:hypothetical protein